MRRQTEPIEVQLERLDAVSLTELREKWRAGFGRPPPPSASRKLLIRALAYQLQEHQLGGLGPATRHQLAQIEKAFCAEGTLPAKIMDVRPPVKPGTRLLRSWQGRLHEVAVLPDGYLCQGKRYESLSSIAKMITGVPRNGPAFFGLRSDAAPR